ncbi:hypothetical protein D3C86_1974620 [compost metagenome]
MSNVATDGDRQPAHVAERAAQAQQVQQGLGGVFMTAVAGVDDGAADFLRQQVDSA